MNFYFFPPTIRNICSLIPHDKREQLLGNNQFSRHQNISPLHTWLGRDKKKRAKVLAFFARVDHARGQCETLQKSVKYLPTIPREDLREKERQLNLSSALGTWTCLLNPRTHGLPLSPFTMFKRGCAKILNREGFSSTGRFSKHETWLLRGKDLLFPARLAGIKDPPWQQQQHHHRHAFSILHTIGTRHLNSGPKG